MRGRDNLAASIQALAMSRRLGRRSPTLADRSASWQHCSGSSGQDDEVSALAGFVAQTLIGNDERRAGDDHLRDCLAHLGWNLNAGEHLRRTLRGRIARPLLLDLAPSHMAVTVAALFDMADMLQRLARQGHNIPAQDGVL